MKSATVIDLDGTLTSVNTFTFFVKENIFRHPLIILPVLLRKLRMISHARAKQMIIKRHFSELEIERFVTNLTPYIRTDLLNRFNDTSLVISTAAPELYVKVLAEKLSINYYTATPTGGKENKGEIKFKNTIVLLQDNNLKLKNVVTDHHDDLPLLKYNDTGYNFLIGPSKETTTELDRQCVEYTVLTRY